VNAAAGPAVPQPHNRRTPLERIDLREEACRADAATLANGPALDALPDITEDGAEGARQKTDSNTLWCLRCLLPCSSLSVTIVCTIFVT